MRNKLSAGHLYIFLLILLLADFSYSFIQYYHTALDGDMAGCIVPNSQIQKVFEDPFGFQAVASGEPHSNPNRYFSHLMYRAYFRTVPFMLHGIADPIESVYLSSAIIKLLTHALILYFLASFMTGTTNIRRKNMLIAFILLTPLFQAYGFNNTMGIIDISITYLFFYALPFLFLIIWIYILRLMILDRKKSNNALLISLTATLALALPLSGPIIAPTILLSVPVAFIYLIFNRKKKTSSGLLSILSSSLEHIPVAVRVITSGAFMVSIYSIYLGTYNHDFASDQISLAERYAILPEGIVRTFSYMKGFGYAYTILALNIYLIKRYFNHSEGRKIVQGLAWTALFIAAYIFLLPLGGYRTYRPFILRYDTILPVTIPIIYLFSISTLFLLKNIKELKFKYLYLFIIGTALMAYTITDAEIKIKNDCEKEALYTISSSDSDPVRLTDSCQVISWYVITKPNESRMNAELMKIWEMTDSARLYYYAGERHREMQ